MILIVKKHVQYPNEKEHHHFYGQSVTRLILAHPACVLTLDVICYNGSGLASPGTYSADMSSTHWAAGAVRPKTKLPIQCEQSSRVYSTWTGATVQQVTPGAVIAILGPPLTKGWPWCKDPQTPAPLLPPFCTRIYLSKSEILTWVVSEQVLETGQRKPNIWANPNTDTRSWPCLLQRIVRVLPRPSALSCA